MDIFIKTFNESFNENYPPLPKRKSKFRGASIAPGNHQTLAFSRNQKTKKDWAVELAAPVHPMYHTPRHAKVTRIAHIPPFLLWEGAPQIHVSMFPFDSTGAASQSLDHLPRIWNGASKRQA